MEIDFYILHLPPINLLNVNLLYTETYLERVLEDEGDDNNKKD